MASIKRLNLFLMSGAAVLALGACGDGASDIASPGGGSVIINPPAPPPPPPPPPSPPAPITAAEFASTAGQTAGQAITVEEQLALASTAPSANNNVSGIRAFAALTNPVVAAPVISPLTPTPTATDPTTLGSSFFQAGSFLGAFSSASDTSFSQWTCNSSAANFGTASAVCSTPPIVVATAAATPAASACPTGTTDGGTNTNVRLCRLPNAINSNLTLPRITGVAYLLSGVVQVGLDQGQTGAATGPTLTIEPGVVVVADPVDSANDVLVISRGAKIDAVGTPSLPIIFTSRQNLSPTGTSDSAMGQWGGIILLGQAPTGVCTTGTGPNDAGGTSPTCQNTMEGLTGQLYGGPNQASNSGRMSYVQIRFTGIDISAGGGNELQGLTLGGVGSGTQLDHIQSHNSMDDGIEVFGGTANLRYIAITGADDDGYDFDNGWRGLVQFMVIAQKPGGGNSDSFTLEVDSNDNEELLPRTYGQIVNFTFIHTAATPAALRLRGGADTRLVNGIIQSTVPCLNVVSRQNRSTIRPADPALQDVGPPIFNSVYFACNNR